MHMWKTKVATMSKDIWHTGKEIPDEDQYIVVKNKAGLYSVGSEFEYDLDRVEKWAYFDDFLALEPELERTRKALDVAVDALKEIDKTRSVANHKIGTQDKTLNSGIVFCWTTPDEVHNALEQITALEQKDVK